MTPTTGSLADDVARAAALLLPEFPEVAAAWLFGSVARGEQRPESDVDVGILFRRRGDTALEPHRALRALGARLEGPARGRRIDLVALESQGPIFRFRVLSEGRLIYDADREHRIDFESDTYPRYFDFLPTWKIAERHALSGYRDCIQGKLDMLRDNLERLAEIPQASYEEFAGEFRNLDSALHRLQTSVQALIDLGSYAVAQRGLGSPTSSFEVLERLEAHGLLPAGSASRFSPIFGFRNRVVHLYDRIDPRIVYRILTAERADLEELLRLLLAVIERT